MVPVWAPVPYPQVRWLDPPGTHPNHLRNGGGPGALGVGQRLLLGDGPPPSLRPSPSLRHPLILGWCVSFLFLARDLWRKAPVFGPS